MQHRISPDIPPVLIEKLNAYHWKQVSPADIKEMMQHLRNLIGFLPAKSATWSFAGIPPTFSLFPDVPQAAFDVLNTRDWEKVSSALMEIILRGADEYFGKMGVPKRTGVLV